jgi:hypothetical protein
MNIVSAKSGHWTDEQLLEHLYGIGPADDHLDQCELCSNRLSSMQTRRLRLSGEEPVGDDFLAAQRRAIYARMSKPHHWWNDVPVRHWAAAAAMFTVLAGSAALYQDHRREIAEAQADAQLAQDVSQMSFDSESKATAPLQGLFIE